MQNKRINYLLLAVCMIAIGVVLWILYLYNVIEHRRFTDRDFHITYTYSHHDENNNGIDDLIDIRNGAKAEINRKPTYRSAYYEGGYPPKEEGVCTDVIWRALEAAGYDFKAMIDADIAACPQCYPRVYPKQDPNIDFRRVPNVHVFLQRHTQALTTDLKQIDQWQGGDIVVFGDTHIGILSDIRNHNGIPFLLHNGGLPKMEEDCLWREQLLKGISGHYRFIYH